MSTLLKLLRNLKISTKAQNCINLNKPNLLGAASNRFYANAPAPYEFVDPTADKILQKEVIDKVNQEVAAREQGRLFAVVHVAGKQFKITEGDVIVIEGFWPPAPGDKIKLDKVLLTGASNFTLVGRPLVEDGLVNVYATVIEKTLSHTKTNFKKKRRKQYTNINCKYELNEYISSQIPPSSWLSHLSEEMEGGFKYDNVAEFIAE